jgi:hypothetical protein
VAGFKGSEQVQGLLLRWPIKATDLFVVFIDNKVAGWHSGRDESHGADSATHRVQRTCLR